MGDWKDRFAELGFRPTDPGGMRGRLQDINIIAVPHPLKGLCLTGNHYNGRSMSEFEIFIPVDSDLQAIAAALVRIHNLVHPKPKAPGSEPSE
jgi:hypothetical protein